MKPTRIFLDMDDVLNCFTMSALEYVGCGGDAVYNPRHGWNIVAAINSLHPSMQFSEAGFWRAIDRKFWATIPKSSECDWLLETCSSLVGRENVCILSAPTLDPDCLAGKMEWIYRFMPIWMHRQFLIGPRKYFCARPDALLIDDRDRNVTDFYIHNGQAITMPRPWNRFHYIESIKEYVESQLQFHFNS